MPQSVRQGAARVNRGLIAAARATDTRFPDRGTRVYSCFMRRFWQAVRASKIVLYGYFAVLMLIGALALWLLPTWGGDDRLSLLDALFTSVSAVAVTGLITVDTAEYTLLGQTIVLVLIQLGGLGIIAFTTLHLTRSGRRLSLQRRAAISEFSIGSVEYDPRRILRGIVLTSLGLETIVAVALIPAFVRHGTGRPVFTAVFHAISAFNNAGFSTFTDSLEGFVGAPSVLLPIMGAIVLGGLGFVVHRDVVLTLFKRRHVASLHTRIVLASSGVFLVSGFFFFLVVEWNGAFSGLDLGERLYAAAFQSVTPRTAGFHTVVQSDLSAPGLVLTLVFMLTGGSPGSIAGGVKVTTVFLILWAALGRIDRAGEARVFGRKIRAPLIAQATMFFVRALLILVASTIALGVTELLVAGADVTFRDLVFESFSAFGTVGLSMGITPGLSPAGKLVIIGTMFAGRVGLISLAIPARGKRWKGQVDYPPGEVLIG
jgi:trk system potassium uptake protein